MAEQTFETWKNVTKGRVYILRQNRLTGLTKHELVNSGRSFQISPDERRLNQENAANNDLDVFANGILCPVKLLDDAEDAKEIASNPNLLSDTDIKDLFSAHYKTFEKKVAEIRNPATLDRLREVGKAEDAAISRMALIEARIDELTPKHETHSQTVDEGPRQVDGAGFKPVSP